MSVSKVYSTSNSKVCKLARSRIMSIDVRPGPCLGWLGPPSCRAMELRRRCRTSSDSDAAVTEPRRLPWQPCCAFAVSRRAVPAVASAPSVYSRSSHCFVTSSTIESPSACFITVEVPCVPLACTTMFPSRESFMIPCSRSSSSAPSMLCRRPRSATPTPFFLRPPMTSTSAELTAS